MILWWVVVALASDFVITTHHCNDLHENRYTLCNINSSNDLPKPQATPITQQIMENPVY